MKCGWSRRASARSMSSRICAHLAHVHRVTRQRPLLEQLAQVLAVQRVVHHLEEPGADLGLVAVADRLQQQFAQRPVLEGHLAEHVEDLAAQRLALFVQLFKQAAGRPRPRASRLATRFQRWQTSVWPMR